MSTTNPRADIGVDIPIERVVVAPIALMDTGAMEMTLVVASPIAPVIPKKGQA